MLNTIVIFIFIRPFISSLGFPDVNFIYSYSFLIFLVLWIAAKGLAIKEIKPLKYPLLAFTAALAISLLFSVNKTAGVNELYKYFSGLLVFWICFSLSQQDKDRVISSILFAAFIVSLLAIYQYFFGFRHILNYLSKQGISDAFLLDYVARKRVFSPFVTPNILAGYLAMTIPLALIKKDTFRVIIPLFIALLLTQSLSAFISIATGLIIYFYFKGKLNKSILGIFAGLLAIIILIFFARSAGKMHTQPAFSVLMRFDYWKGAWEIIKASPWVGVGLGNFNLAQSRYAHNSYLQIWAEMGILGMISFLWLVIYALKNNAKNTALIAACSIFLINNLFDFSFFLPEVSLIWWAMLGLL